MKSPWLSVIVPTYNGAAYLAHTLDSVAIQRDPDIEIIAIDDGSTDDTVAILSRYAKSLPIRVIERGRVGSWVANSDYALRQAVGEYACFLHQDDFWYPGRLSNLRDCVRQFPATVLWLHPVWYVDALGKRLGRWTCPLPARREGLSAEKVLEHMLVQNFVGMPAPLFRRDAFLATGGMDSRLWYVADWGLWLSLAEQGLTGYVPKALAAFRIHTESQTVQRGRDLNDLREQHWSVFQKHFPKWTMRDDRTRANVQRAFEASTDLNLCLMGRVQNQEVGLGPLLWKLMCLGPRGWRRLLRDSRIGERLIARIKCRRRGQFVREIT
jgi:glycosyltransferase involved in cell wall biosynthesis